MRCPSTAGRAVPSAPQMTTIAVAKQILGALGTALPTLLLLLLTLTAHAATPIAQFDQANRLYEQGKFADAATGYQQLIAAGHTSATVYYNLGNAWFKAGQLGRSVAAYRRAQELSPRDPNIRFNLDFARRQVAGGNALAPNLWQRLPGRLTLNEWAVLAAIPFWICFALLILREWKPAWRRPLRSYTIVAASLATLVIAMLAIAVYQSGAIREAVVVTQEAVVRYGPLEDSRVQFQLRNGAEVEIVGRKENGPAGAWLQVRDGSNRIGWLKRDQVVIL
jgi:tetratricopeptide (TPR) repeat protein